MFSLVQLFIMFWVTAMRNFSDISNSLSMLYSLNSWMYFMKQIKLSDKALYFLSDYLCIERLLISGECAIKTIRCALYNKCSPSYTYIVCRNIRYSSSFYGLFYETRIRVYYQDSTTVLFMKNINVHIINTFVGFRIRI